MYFSRIISVFSIFFILSSCTFPSLFQKETVGNIPGVAHVGSGSTGVLEVTTTNTHNTPISSSNSTTSFTSTMILNKEYLPPITTKAIPVILNTPNIDESEKDDCARKLESLVDQQNCIDTFYAKKATLTKNISICNTISNSTLRDTCTDSILLQEITTKNDVTLCKNLKNPDTIGNCFAIIGKQKQAQGEKIVGAAIDSCIDIADKDIQSACTESAIFNESVRARDPMMCQTLVSEIKQTMCANLIKSILENGNPLK